MVKLDQLGAIIHFSGIILCVLVICLIAFGPPVKRCPSSSSAAAGAAIECCVLGKKLLRFLLLISILFTSKDQAFPQAKEMEAIEVSKQGIICK